MACINVFVEDVTSRLELHVSRICYEKPIELFCYLLDSDGNRLLDNDNRLLVIDE